MTEPSRLDFIIFGASGFTGIYTVEIMAKIAAKDRNITWGVAGRNMAKLQTSLADASRYTGIERLDETIPIVIADVKSSESLDAMCKRAKIILNCVGPYRFFGEAVVKAAIRNKCHHLDISGEPQYLETIQLRYDNEASEAGVYVIGAAGFDSIPADLGVEFAREKFPGDLNSIEGFLSLKAPQGGGLHYGTWQSAIHGVANWAELASLRKSLYPLPGPKPTHRASGRGAFFRAPKSVQPHRLTFLHPSDNRTQTTTKKVGCSCSSMIKQYCDKSYYPPLRVKVACGIEITFDKIKQLLREGDKSRLNDLKEDWFVSDCFNGRCFPKAISGVGSFTKTDEPWAVLFPAADKSVIYRSQRWFGSQPSSSDNRRRPIQYSHFLIVPNFLHLIMMILFGGLFGILARFSFGRYLLETFPKWFSFGLASHEGPTRHQIENSSFELTMEGWGYPEPNIYGSDKEKESFPSERIIARVSGPEAGYISTPIVLIEAGLCVLRESNKIPRKGGVLTPAVAFTKTSLIEQLRKHGIIFEVI